MNVVFIFSPPWPTWAPNYTIALFESITKSCSDIKFRGIDLNVLFYNMISDDERYLWEDSYSYKWRENDRLAEFDAKYGSRIQDLLIRHVDSDTLACAFSVHGNSSLFALYCAKILKSKFPGIPVVFGGSACFPECRNTQNEILNHPDVDAVFTGEGEISWPAYLSERLKGVPNPVIKGIITKSGENGGEAEKCSDLDCVRPIDYRSFDLDMYSQRNRYILTTSRGCVNRCVFCSESPNYGPFRTRAPERVFQEILSIVHLSREHGFSGVPHIGFNDSLMNGNMGKFEKLLDLIIDNKIDIRWETMMAIRKEMTADIFHKCKESGCLSIMWGLESGCAKTLVNMNKRLFTPELATEVFEKCHQAEIAQYTNIIVGFPTESEDDFQETLNFIKHIKKYFTAIGVSSLQILPNAPLYEKFIEYGIENREQCDNWTSQNGDNNMESRRMRIKKIRSIIDESQYFTTDKRR